MDNIIYIGVLLFVAGVALGLGIFIWIVCDNPPESLRPIDFEEEWDE